MTKNILAVGRFQRLLALLSWAILVLGLPGAARADRTFLSQSELLVLGVSLHVEPATQVVPIGLPTVVKTALVAAGRPDVKVPVGNLPPGMRVHAELKGPGISGSIPLECAPGADLSVPVLAERGRYTVENIRLLDEGGALLFMGEPSLAEIQVQNILITRIESRPLTLAELEERGIVIDESSFQVLNFTVSMALESGIVEIDIPMLMPTGADGPALGLPKIDSPIDIGPAAEAPPPPRGGPEVTGQGFIPEPDKLAGEGRKLGISGALVFPQAVGFLQQFHAVVLMLTNGAPETSPLVLKDLQATFTLPAGKLELAKTNPLTNPGTPVPVRDPGADAKLGTPDDRTSLPAGASGQAEIVTRGLEEGTHRVDAEVTGTITGLPGGSDTITGKVAGVVCVRNPKFSLTFMMPGVVQEGREFEYAVVLTNTTDVPANLASIRMPASSVSGGVLKSPELVVFPTIPAWGSATARYKVKALRTGRVAATRFSDPSGNLEGRFILQLAIGDDGIPLSPEVVQLPDVAYQLPQPLVDSLLAFTGSAWANATAPAGSLPAGMAQLRPSAVTRFAAQIADAGQRLTLGEPRLSVLSHLLLRAAGGEKADWELDALRRRSSRWPEANAAFAAALGDELGSNTAGWLAGTIATNHFYLAPFVLAALDTDADGAARLLIEDDVRRRLGGAEGARDLATGELLGFGPRRALGLVAAPAGEYAVSIEGVTGGNVTLTLIVPWLDGASGQVRLNRVDFPAVALAAGATGKVTFNPSTSSYALGIGAASYPGEVTPISAPDLALVSATVAASMDAGNHVVALFFNRPVDLDAAVTASSYTFAGEAMAGEKVVSVRPQVSGRFLIVRLLNPVPPTPQSAVSAPGLKDADGTPISPASATATIAGPARDDWGTVSGTVIDGKGRPIAGIPVLLSETVPTSYGGEYVLKGSALTTSDASGGFKFWFTRHSGRVLQLQAVNARAETATAYATLRNDHESLRLDLRFLGRGDVFGRVLDPSGSPMDRALVTGRATTTQDFAQAWTGSDGRFQLSNLPVGAINLSAKTSRGQFGAKTALVPDAGARVDAGDLVVDAYDTGVVQGRVTENGVPVQAAPVVIRSYRTSPPWGTWMRTDVDGAYRFTGVPAGGDVEVIGLDPYDVGTQRAIARDLLSGASLTLNLFYASGKGSVTGRVVDAWGRPAAAGVPVWIQGLSSTTTDAAGRFTLANLPLGTHSVYAGTAPYIGGASAPIRYDGQVAEVTVRLPALGSVEVTVTGEGMPTHTDVRLRYSTLKCATSAASSDCTIGDVPVGMYTVDVLKTVSNPPDPPDKVAAVAVAVVRFPGDLAQVTVALPGRVKLDGVTKEGNNVAGGVRVQLWANAVDSEDQLDQVEYPAVTSDPATGYYSFDSVLEGPYRLRASSPLIPTEASASGPLLGPTTVDLVFPTGVSNKDLTLHVLMPDGSADIPSPQDLHSVLTMIDPPFPPLDHEGQDQVFSVAPGRFLVEAHYQASGGPLYKAVASGSFSQADTFPLRLLGFGTVQGQVLDGGQPVVGAEVTLRAMGLPDEIVNIPAITDAGGRFRVDNVREGLVSVTATHLSGSGSASGSVAHAGTLDVLVSFTPSHTLAGSVKREDGTSAAAGVSVLLKRLMYHDGFPRWDVIDGCVSDSGGGFLLGPVPYDPVDGTAYRLFAFDLTTGRYAGRDLVLNDATGAVTLRLGARGGAEGTVFESNGSTPLPGSRIELQAGSAAPEVPGVSLFTSAEESGYYRFFGVPEGSFEERATKNQTVLVASGTGRVQSEGDIDRLDLVLEANGVVAGKVSRDGSPMPSLPVKLWGRSSTPRETQSGSDGSFEFRDVPLGAFSLTAKGIEGDNASYSGRLDRDAQVAAVDLALAGFATVNVTVDDGGGSGDYDITVVHDGGTDAKTGRSAVSFPNVHRGQITVHTTSQANPSIQGVATAVIPATAASLDVTVSTGPVSGVSGTITDSDGTTPLKDVVVELWTGGQYYLRKTDAQGAFSFPAVRAEGSLRLDAHTEDGSGSTRVRETWPQPPTPRVHARSLDRVAPAFVSSSPANQAADVPAGITAVALTFTEPMDGPMLAEGRARLLLDGVAVPGVTVTAPGNQAQLGFAAGTLLPARTYTAIVARTAQDANGQPLGGDVAIRFTTLDTVSPTSTLENPAEGAPSVPLGTAVKVLFSEPMQESTLAAGVTLVCGGEQLSAPTADAAKLRAVFAGGLLADASCTVSVTAAAKDLAGNGAAPRSFTFHSADTLAPLLTGIDVPGAGPFSEGSSLAVQAQPDSSSNDVARVDYFVGGALKATATAAPWQGTIEVPTMVEAGGDQFQLSALASDEAGNVSDPFVVTLGISADAPPVVDIILPADGAQFDVNAAIPVQVNATDPGGIVSVTYSVDGLAEQQGEKACGGAATCTLTDSFVAPPEFQPGYIYVQATATDRNGNTVSARPNRISLLETSVEGIVKLPDGNLAPGVTVTLAGAPGTFTGNTDGDGHYRVGARPGDFTIVYNEESTGRRARRGGVTLTAGDTTQLSDTTLGGAGTVHGTVSLSGAPYAGGALVRVNTPYGPITGTSDGAGGFTIGKVPAVLAAPAEGISVEAQSLPTGFFSQAVSDYPVGDGFDISGVALTLRTPIVTQIAPDSGGVDDAHDAVITGDWFGSGVTVTSDDVGVTWTPPVDPQHLSVHLGARSNGVANLLITNPDGGTATTSFRYNAADLGTLLGTRSVYDIQVSGDRLYAAADDYMVHVFARENGAWTEKSTVQPSSGGLVYRITVIGNWLFTGDNQGYASLFNVTDPASPVAAGSVGGLASLVKLIAVGPTEAWAVAGNRVERLGVSPSGTLETRGRTYLGYKIGDAALVGNRLYLTSRNYDKNGNSSSYGGLRVFDVSDPDQPVLLADKLGTYGVLAVAGTRVIAMNEYWQSYGLEILDASNPRDMQVLASAALGSGEVVSHIMLSGDRAYVALNQRLVKVLSMTDGAVLDDEAVDVVTGNAVVSRIAGTSIFVGSYSGGVHEFRLLPEPRAPHPVAVTRPASTPAGGGTLSVAGYDFVPGATVKVGGADATVEFVGENWARIQAPAHAADANPVDVQVTNPDGRQGTLAGKFSYTNDARLFGIRPAYDSYLGGAPIQVDGINLEGATLHFGTVDRTIAGGMVSAPAGSGGQLWDVSLGPDTLAKGFLSAWYRLDIERQGPLEGSSWRGPASGVNADGSINLATYTGNAIEFTRLAPDGRVLRHGAYKRNGENWADHQLVGDLLYVSVFSNGPPSVRVVDLFHEPDPSVVATITDTMWAQNAGAIRIAGDRLYSSIAGCVWDIADLSNPVRLGCLGTDLNDFRVDGRYVYDLQSNPNLSGYQPLSHFRVYDYGSLARPVLKATITIDANSSFDLSGNLAVLHGNPSSSHSLYSIDLANPESPVLHGPFGFPAGQYGLDSDGTARPAPPVVIGDDVYAPTEYTSTGGPGWQIFDASDVSSLVAGATFAQSPELTSDGRRMFNQAMGSRIVSQRYYMTPWILDTAARDADPVLAGISPASGAKEGGTVVTLTGKRFEPRADVRFGSTPAASVLYVNSGRLRAVAPAGTGTVQVKVVNPNGRQSGTKSFTFQDGPPAVDEIVPAAGGISGGTAIKVKGWGFAGVQKVVFRQGTASVEVLAAQMQSVSPTQLTFTVPAAPAQTSGYADVDVVTANGQSTFVAGFSYEPDAISSGNVYGTLFACDGTLYQEYYSGGGQYSTRSFDLTQAAQGFPEHAQFGTWVYYTQGCIKGHAVAPNSSGISQDTQIYDRDGTLTSTVPINMRKVEQYKDRMYTIAGGNDRYLRVYDVSDLTNIVSLSSQPQDGTAPLWFSSDRYNLLIDGGWTAASSFDLAGDSPSKLFTWPIHDTAALSGNVAFVWDTDGLDLYDLTNPAAPVKQAAYPVRKGQVVVTPWQVFSGAGSLLEVWDRQGDFGLTFHQLVHTPVAFDNYVYWDGYVILGNGPTFLKLSNLPDTLALASVYPKQGPKSGGQDLLVQGVGLDRTTEVKVGGTVAAWQPVSPTEILVTTPSYTGSTPSAVELKVTGVAPESATAMFTYETGQRARYMSPCSGPSGSTVWVGLEVDPATSLTATAGGQSATVTLDHPKNAKVVLPTLSPGPANLVVQVDSQPVSLPCAFTVTP